MWTCTRSTAKCPRVPARWKSTWITFRRSAPEAFPRAPRRPARRRPRGGPHPPTPGATSKQLGGGAGALLRREPLPPLRFSAFLEQLRSAVRPGAPPVERQPLARTRAARPGSLRAFRGTPSARVCPFLERKVSRSEEHTSELQSLAYLVCRLLLEKKKMNIECH